MVWLHAILSRFISVFLICLTALIGDNLVYVYRSNRLYKAICDNLTHGAIGALTWAIIGYFARLPRWQGLNVALCTTLAMVIDLDHFAAARSFRIEDASSLSHRPPLHCTTIPILFIAFGFFVAKTTKSCDIARFTCLAGGAFFSHHFRDAARRGLWLWPFGSTPSFPPLLYFSSIAVLPHILVFLIIEFEGKQKLQNAYFAVQSV